MIKKDLKNGFPADSWIYEINLELNFKRHYRKNSGSSVRHLLCISITTVVHSASPPDLLHCTDSKIRPNTSQKAQICVIPHGFPRLMALAMHMVTISIIIFSLNYLRRKKKREMHRAISQFIKFYLGISKCNKNEHTLIFSKAKCQSITPDSNFLLLSFRML